MPRLDVDTQTGCLVFDGTQFGDWTTFVISDPAAVRVRNPNREFTVRAFTRDDIAFLLDAEPELEKRIRALSDDEMEAIAGEIAEDLNAEFYRLLGAIAGQHLSSGEE